MSNEQWCPITRSADIIGDRWSLLILRELMMGPKRFKTIKANISSISMDQLTRKLEHLCVKGIIVRQEYSEAPPRVEYQLTEIGKSFMPVLRRVFIWANQNIWGKPGSQEQIDVSLTLRLMCSFLGRGEGCVEIRVCHSGKTDSYLLERGETQNISVRNILPHEVVNLIGVQSVVTLNLRDWIRLVSQKENIKSEKIWGKIEGDITVLKNLLPVFEKIEFELTAVKNHHPNNKSQHHAIDGKYTV
ncbi:MAG: helix-turn-helix domain-containing protein [Oligoflexia bacterium]|nr:helix-turn-helix domain-containing protein [Oligoflexia bacterium]